MTDGSRARIEKDGRRRLHKRGLARFDVVGRSSDQALLRLLAKRMADDGPEAVRIREAVGREIAEKPRGSSVGGIFAALRRSPLVGADLDLSCTRRWE